MLSPLELTSCGVCVLLAIGLLNRHRKRVHIPCMVCAFLVDMGMVLYIELNRGAIKSARERMGPLMMVHIALSLVVVVLYFGQIVSGIRKVKGKPSAWHGRTGCSLMLFRLGNLITSIMVMNM